MKTIKIKLTFLIGIIFLLAIMIYSIRQGNGKLESNTILQIMATIGFAGFFLYLGLDYAQPALNIAGLRRDVVAKATRFAWGLLLFFLCHLAVLVSWWLVAGLIFFPQNLSYSLLAYGVVIAVTVAIWEELIYRGPCLWLIERAGRNRFFAIFCIIAQSWLFAWVHVSGSWATTSPYALSVFCAGILFGLLSVWSKSLWLAMGAHAGWNLFGYIGHGINHRPLQVHQGLFSTAGSSYGQYLSIALAVIMIGVFVGWWRSK